MVFVGLNVSPDKAMGAAACATTPGPRGKS
jgi:hypothetical protein